MSKNFILILFLFIGIGIYGQTQVNDKEGNETPIYTKYGNVGIGLAPSSGIKLDVAGTIRADEIKVEDIAANNITIKANGNTADFVFSDTYNLKDLTEVENYIKTHKHLPDIPSAEEMEASGVNLAEMNKLLLQKVEELTLYTIELKKRDKEKEEKLVKIENKRIKDKREVYDRLAKLESLLLEETNQ